MTDRRYNRLTPKTAALTYNWLVKPENQATYAKVGLPKLLRILKTELKVEGELTLWQLETVIRDAELFEIYAFRAGSHKPPQEDSLHFLALEQGLQRVIQRLDRLESELGFNPHSQ